MLVEVAGIDPDGISVDWNIFWEKVVEDVCLAVISILYFGLG